MTLPDPSRFELLTFDCYGTLVDWEAGIVAAARPACEARGVTPSDDDVLASFGQVEHTVQAERFRPYREVLAIAFDRMCQRWGFRPSPAECAAFADSVGDWPPFPDTTPALRQLARTYRLGIVSNVDDDLFARTQARLGVAFDWVVTAEQVGSYKPAPGHFLEMEARSGVPRNRILLAAQSLFHDIVPATSLGYATVHVNRPSMGAAGGATPPASGRPDAVVPDMAALAQLLS